jgi:hypothetical protein
MIYYLFDNIFLSTATKMPRYDLDSDSARHVPYVPKQLASRARIYRPSFHENKPKTLVFTFHFQRFGWFSRKQGL